ncbi:MAG TPA: hypothetical protein V6C71_25230 [Coleofasciculaceae cyanobacterium]|jgi:hypothetical protein
MSLENWDNFPDLDICRQKVNNFLNHFLDIEKDAEDEEIFSDFRYGKWQRIISLPARITI